MRTQFSVSASRYGHALEQSAFDVGANATARGIGTPGADIIDNTPRLMQVAYNAIQTHIASMRVAMTTTVAPVASGDCGIVSGVDGDTDARTVAIVAAALRRQKLLRSACEAVVDAAPEAYESTTETLIATTLRVINGALALFIGARVGEMTTALAPTVLVPAGVPDHLGWLLLQSNVPQDAKDAVWQLCESDVSALVERGAYVLVGLRPERFVKSFSSYNEAAKAQLEQQRERPEQVTYVQRVGMDGDDEVQMGMNLVISALPSIPRVVRRVRFVHNMATSRRSRSCRHAHVHHVRD